MAFGAVQGTVALEAFSFDDAQALTDSRARHTAVDVYTYKELPGDLGGSCDEIYFTALQLLESPSAYNASCFEGPLEQDLNPEVTRESDACCPENLFTWKRCTNLPEALDVGDSFRVFSNDEFEAIISGQLQMFSNFWDTAVDPADLELQHMHHSRNWSSYEPMDATCIDSNELRRFDEIPPAEISSWKELELSRLADGTLAANIPETRGCVHVLGAGITQSQLSPKHSQLRNFTHDSEFECEVRVAPSQLYETITSASDELHKMGLIMFDSVEFTDGQLLYPDHSGELVGVNADFENILRYHLNNHEMTYTHSREGGHSFSEGDEMNRYYVASKTFHGVSTIDSITPVTQPIVEHMASANVSPDAKITNCNNEEVVEDNLTLCSHEREVENIQTVERQNIDWECEKELIALKMLGKRTARKVYLEEKLRNMVEYFKNSESTGVPPTEQSLSSFQREITMIMNDYCKQENTNVRYLPNFCRKLLSEWVGIEEHQQNPYPEKPEIHRLAMELGLSYNQVEQWFENYRVRSWKPAQSGIRKGKYFRYPDQSTAILKEWLRNNRDHPNPKGRELKTLTEKTGMTSEQVKQWCYNFRRRHSSDL